MSAVAGKHSLRTALLVVATAATTACRVGTSLPVEEVDALVFEEAQAMTAALLMPALENTIFSANHASFTHQHGASAIHEHPVSGPWSHDRIDDDGPLLSHHNLYTFDLTVEPDCSAGGSLLLEAAVTGEGNPSVEAGVVHYVIIQTPSECALPLAEVGDFVVDASPYLTLEAHATNDGTTTRIYGLVEGGISWQAESKAGTCQIDLEWEGTGASMDEITAVQISGDFCDLEDLSWSMVLDG